MKKLFTFLSMLILCIGSMWATVSFKADTPYLMIQRQSGKYVNMEYLNYDAALRSSWSLIYFTASEGGYVVSNGTNKLSAEGYFCYARDSKSTVWTISEVDGVANGYKLYQNTSGSPGYFGSDEYAEGKPCFCDKAIDHASTTFIIIEANVYVKIQELKTIPALYGSSDIEQAITMIKGTSLSTSQQESILEALYESAEGKKFYAVNNSSGSTTRYMNVGDAKATGNNTSLTTDAVMTVEYAGDGKYYLKGNNNKYICAPSNAANQAPLTTNETNSAGQYYIGNKDKTTNNYVFFTTSYSTTGTDRKALHWINNADYLTGWSYDVPASQWTIFYMSDEEYISLSDAESETLNYTLTDANGATYSGTITGKLGVNPTFTGCDSYSLSNSAWNISTKTFTSDVTFPFKISSNGKSNYTYIGSYQSQNFYWYVTSSSATVVNAQYQNAPTNQSGELEKYEWAIIPSCTNGAFKFTIKNASTGTYVTSTSTEKKHDTSLVNNPIVSLSSTGTTFTYASNKQWCLPTTLNNDGSTPLYLSLNSSGVTSGLQYIGTWTSHNGTKVQYYDPDNFPTLISDLTTVRNTASTYTIGTRVGEYSETSSGTMATALSNANGIIEGTAYGTATMINSYKTALNNAISGVSLNIPTKPIFMRIRSSQGVKGYMTTANANGRATFTQNTDASTIYLWASDSKLVSYGNGLAYNMMYVPKANGAEGVEYSVIPAVSGNVGQYSITCPDDKSQTIYLYSTGSGNADRNTVSDNATWKQRNSFTLEEVTSLPVTFNSSALGYATFNSPVALKVPTDVKAYVCKIEGSTITLHNANKFLDGDNWILPANTPVLLYNKEYETNATKDFEVTSTTESYEDLNDFKYTVYAAMPNNTDYTYYALRKKSGAMGFYQRADQTAVLPGFRAWIMDPITSAREFTIVFDGEDNPTGIAEALGLENDNVEIYDLNGRKLSSYKHGINIVNGKKVFK